MIAAANKIRTKPYVYGGGHGRWWDRGYDCSGAVSYALHGGEFIDSPLPSGPMAKWGLAGLGRWITVYTNPGHAYAVIAGYAGTPPATPAENRPPLARRPPRTTSASSRVTRRVLASFSKGEGRHPSS